MQALKYAIDRDFMVRNVTLGFGEIGNDLFGKHLPCYLEDLPKGKYDPERARKLLADAGLSNLTLTIRTTGDLVWARAPVMSAANPKVHNVKSLGYPSFPSFRAAFLA